tara:strand:+ start:205 stop:411 length:207 start_codon:yes stop_codon:yes gene_type:complete
MKSMSIDPEVIPPSSSAGFNSVRFIPRWAIYGAISLGVLVVVGILKTLLPLILMGLLLGFIWHRAKIS